MKRGLKISYLLIGLAAVILIFTFAIPYKLSVKEILALQAPKGIPFSEGQTMMVPVRNDVGFGVAHRGTKDYSDAMHMYYRRLDDKGNTLVGPSYIQWAGGYAQDDFSSANYLGNGKYALVHSAAYVSGRLIRLIFFDKNGIGEKITLLDDINAGDQYEQRVDLITGLIDNKIIVVATIRDKDDNTGNFMIILVSKTGEILKTEWLNGSSFHVWTMDSIACSGDEFAIILYPNQWDSALTPRIMRFDLELNILDDHDFYSMGFDYILGDNKPDTEISNLIVRTDKEGKASYEFILYQPSTADDKDVFSLVKIDKDTGGIDIQEIKFVEEPKPPYCIRLPRLLYNSDAKEYVCCFYGDTFGLYSIIFKSEYSGEKLSLTKIAKDLGGFVGTIAPTYITSYKDKYGFIAASFDSETSKCYIGHYFLLSKPQSLKAEIKKDKKKTSKISKQWTKKWKLF